MLHKAILGTSPIDTIIFSLKTLYLFSTINKLAERGNNQISKIQVHQNSLIHPQWV